MTKKWYDRIDWQPMAWAGIFILLIGISFFVSEEHKTAAALLNILAGSIAPRIRSTNALRN